MKPRRLHFASWFMMRGGNLLALSRILGHAKVSMTEKYARLAPDLLRAEISKNRSGTNHWNHEHVRATRIPPKW